MTISNEIFPIPLKDIEVSSFNVRRTEPDDIDELAESIKKYGLLQPIVLEGKKTDAPPYRLIVGQRRFRAHEKLGLKNIRSVFYDQKDEWQLRMLSLSENMHRKNLNYADAAEAITSMYKHFKGDYAKVAKELGLSEMTVREYVRIEEQATPKAKQLLKLNKVTKADVRRAIVAGGGEQEKVDAILEEIGSLTRYEKDRLVDYAMRNSKADVPKLIIEAKKPKYERTVIVNLDVDIDKALSSAVEKMSVEREKIAVWALEDWLKEKGFLATKQEGK